MASIDQCSIVLRMPPEAKGWRATVLVYNLADELLATDEGNLMSLTGRKMMATRLVQQLALNELEAERFRERLNDSWLAFYQEYQTRAAAGPSQLSAAELLNQMPEEIRLEAEEQLRSFGILDKIGADIAALGVAGETELILTLYLVGVSRQLRKPLNARVHGPTSSGKSYVVETVSDCFPPETIIHATQITPQAFFHMEPDSLRNRFIVGGERSRKEDDDAVEKTRALRELQATGRLSKLITTKGPQGQMITKHIEQEGPIAYVETTSTAKVFEEDANRCLGLFTDEQPEQTRNIIRTLADHYRGVVSRTDRRRIVQRHYAIQRLLQPCTVVVPYADRLAELLDYKRVELRRGFPQIMSLIQATTLLHQWQRDRDKEGRLIATREDYEVSRALLLKPMARLLGVGVSEPAKRFYDRLHARFLSAPFSTTEAWKQDSYSKDAIRGWLGELFEAGMLRVVTESKGRSPTVWEVTGNSGQACSVLPTLQQVFPSDSQSRHRDKA